MGDGINPLAALAASVASYDVIRKARMKEKIAEIPKDALSSAVIVEVGGRRVKIEVTARDVTDEPRAAPIIELSKPKSSPER